MMGRQDPQQPLYCVVNLDERVPEAHPLRKIKELVDFSFVPAEVTRFYGYNGNESLGPGIILKLLFLLFLDDVRSERELMRQVAYRLDYLWFLGLGLNDPAPDHSVLSKARSRWGPAVFEKLFVRTVRQCVEAGLVDGRKVHVDASVVDANAGKNSVLTTSPQIAVRLKALYAEQEAKLQEVRESRRKRPVRKTPDDASPQAEPGPSNPYRIGSQHLEKAPPQSPAAKPDPVPVEPPPPPGDLGPGEPEGQAPAKVNDALICTTDPDATIARHAPNCKSGPRPRYMSHRAVDDRSGVITAVASTSGDANEGTLLVGLIEQHEHNTQLLVETAVADSKYGIIENYIACEELGVVSHMADAAAAVHAVQDRPQRQAARPPRGDRPGQKAGRQPGGQTGPTQADAPDGTLVRRRLGQPRAEAQPLAKAVATADPGPGHRGRAERADPLPQRQRPQTRQPGEPTRRGPRFPAVSRSASPAGQPGRTPGAACQIIGHPCESRQPFTRLLMLSFRE